MSLTIIKNGDTLTNFTNHKKDHNSASTSIGFCFFNLDDHKPEEALHFLTGIATCEVCVVFEVDEKLLTKAQGRYTECGEKTTLADLLMSLLDPSTIKHRFLTEYCTTQYSKKDFKLVKYAIPDWYEYEWHWKKR